MPPRPLAPERRAILALLPVAALLLVAAACARAPEMTSPALPGTAPGVVDALAERYVRLVLGTGEHDEGYVDAYYGPEAWQQEVAAAPPSREALRAEADRLLAELGALPPAGDEMEQLRRRYLARQTEAVATRLDMLGGARLTFDEESRALYDAVAPHQSETELAALVAALDSALPGDGPVPERLEAFRQRFVIPSGKLDAVFRAAVDECRERTAAHLELPPGESFSIEYVTDKPWSGYNWYQGGYRSLIQVNTDLPIFVDRAVDLACHEGYPGHHVYNALLEKHLVRDRGWVELSVYPLYSPQSLIAEGSANYGIEMAFPGEERIAYERDVLFPLAGLDPATADEFYRVMALADKLSYAGNAAARRYLDGEIDAEEAVRWLADYALMAPDRARQRLRFIDTYRSYVINYNLGKDLVAAHVETLGGDDPAARWRVFEELLSTPRMPSDLAGAD